MVVAVVAVVAMVAMVAMVAHSLQQYGHDAFCCQAVIGLLILLNQFNDPLNHYIM